MIDCDSCEYAGTCGYYEPGMPCQFDEEEDFDLDDDWEDE